MREVAHPLRLNSSKRTALSCVNVMDFELLPSLCFLSFRRNKGMMGVDYGEKRKE